MIRKPFLFTLIVVFIVALSVAGATAQEGPQLLSTGGCVAGSEYDPACDVDHDSDTDIVDIQLTASHWGQAGVWTGDGDFWSLTGNGIAAGQFLGTTNDEPLVFKTNDTEAMRIDTAGNVGIGTTSPGAGLELAKTSLTIRDSAGATTQVRIESQATVTTTLGPNRAGGESQLILTDASGKDEVVLRSGRSGAGGQGSIHIGLNGENKVWLDSNGASFFNGGNVGIGTTSPGEKLHVVGNLRLDSDLICSDCVQSSDVEDGQIRSVDLADGAVNSAKIADGSVGTSDLANGAVTLGKLAANSVDASKIADGSIGVADVITTEIQQRVTGTCAAGNAIRVVNADGTVTCESTGGGSDGEVWSLVGNSGTISTTHFLGTTDAEPLIIKTNGAEAMRIDTAGNVGIGTTSPGAGLDLARSSLIIRDSGGATTQVRVESQSTVQPGIGPTIAGGESQLVLSNSGADTIVLRSGRTSAPQTGSISIGHGGNERVRLDSNGGSWFNGGNVGIGTTSPGAGLDLARSSLIIRDSGGATTQVRIESQSAVQPGIGPTVAGGESQLVLSDSSGNAEVVLRSGRTSQPGQGSIHIGYNGNDKVWIDSNGYSYFNGGNVGIGTDQPEAKLDVRGRTKTEVLEITGGGDLAEPFEIAGPDRVEPGMVVAIDPAHPGQLRIADQAYDRTVAGCISGAGGSIQA